MSGLVGTMHTQSGNVGVSIDTAHAWCRCAGGGSPAITTGYNMKSITDHGTGDYTTVWLTPLINATPLVLLSADIAGINTGSYQPFSPTAVQTQVRFFHRNDTVTDPEVWSMLCLGG